MIRHIVAWDFQPQFSAEENKEHAKQIKQGLESLKGIIEEIVSIEVVCDLASSSSRDMMLTSLFQTEADLQAYQVHPEHKKVSAFVGSVMHNRVCLDFEEK